MGVEKCHGTVLVIDDRYAVDLSGRPGPPEFSRPNFEEKIAARLPFKFEYASAWDKAADRYTLEEAIRAVEKSRPNGVLLDISFGGITDRLGVSILAELTKRFPEVPVVVMTALDKQDVWTECARLGAVDYINKPLDASLLGQTLDRYVGAPPKFWLIGQAPQFVQAVQLAALSAKGGRISVMVTGDTGCGKELLAHFIHRHGPRSSIPLGVVYLAGGMDDQKASDIFGHSKGAYTGAVQDKNGSFVEADGGIVFLDEIADIGEMAQDLLLRIVEDGMVARIGDRKKKKVDVQIVSATNRDLAKLVKDGAFREDLWERLNGRTIVLPPLAQRREDIPMLVRHLLRVDAMSRKPPVAAPALPVHLERQIQQFPWERNVRELGNYAKRVLDVVGGGMSAEGAFVAELPPRNEVEPLVPVRRPSQEAEGIGASQSGRSLGPLGPQQIQRLRLEELGLLHRALLDTRDRVTNDFNRANAAALLKGKRKGHTPEFDRWLNKVWKDLDDESRVIGSRSFPELMPWIESLKG